MHLDQHTCLKLKHQLVSLFAITFLYLFVVFVKVCDNITYLSNNVQEIALCETNFYLNQHIYNLILTYYQCCKKRSTRPINHRLGATRSLTLPIYVTGSNK
jgi:hypothetical protein